ncbi:class I SAM-dependent methyltransferase [Candidatus Woesearchaeota archaeon]|nr:class I SAM-dependent methyltransferase [Candidatus Woesearchaeota archaeon]
MDDSRFMTPIRFRIERMLPELVKNYAPQEPSVLDLGCGRGMYSQLFVQYPSFSYVGIDLKERKEWKTFQSKNITYQAADATHVPYPDEHFNFAIAITSLEHIKDEKGAMRELFRLVKKGSYVVIIVPTKPYWLFQLGRHCFHHNSKKQLYQLVQTQSFEIIEYEKVGGILSFLFTCFDIWLSQAILLPLWLYRKIRKKPLTSEEMDHILEKTVHWYINFTWSNAIYRAFLQCIDQFDLIFRILPNHHSIVLKKENL